MTVRGVGWLFGGDFRLAGWAVALAAGLAAVLLFARWVWPLLPRSAAITAIAVLMLYPYSIFLYGPEMSDSFFLLLAVGAFVALERRWFWVAGLVGALATAGRPVGVAVAIGLVVRTLELIAERRPFTVGPAAVDDPPAGRVGAPVTLAGRNRSTTSTASPSSTGQHR
jgi:Gpi18-like mannosyltransferase